MTELAEKAQALNRLIRPLTFPIGVKLVKSADDFPERTRRPAKDMGFKTMLCVGITLARKYGWTVGMTAEDNACAVASYAYGWSEDDAESEKGITDFVKAMNYAANDDAAKARLDTIRQVKLDKGQYAGVVFSPLERSKIEPDLVMVFGNSAQVMRLVHGATQGAGASLHSAFRGFWDSCLDGVLRTLKDRQPNVLLAGNGERVWAMVQDDELLFTIPADSLDQVITGLEATDRSGIRYPIPVDVRHEPSLPGQLQQSR
jgi:uncharacterized protein (DUF169 family)